MINNDKFELRKKSLENTKQSKINKIKKDKERLIAAQNNNDEVRIESCIRILNNDLDILSTLEEKLDCMRPNNEKDMLEREKIRKSFSETVSQVIPDDVCLVFHGNDNIGTVERIIESGGLFTIDERNINSRSFATCINITYKNNIQTSVDFACPSEDDFMPYGAIFVFYPSDDEKDEIISMVKSGTTSEGEVNSVNFITEPDRLFSIITTEENIQRLKTKCDEKRIDSSKVMTHDNFIDYCNDMFKNYGQDEIPIKR